MQLLREGERASTSPPPADIGKIVVEKCWIAQVYMSSVETTSSGTKYRKNFFLKTF